ncbi:MAG: DUF692 domain-containing protein [Novosphingobium sp.]|nr:DUF692 domain-containing protein [Novosphingobium sp.]
MTDPTPLPPSTGIGLKPQHYRAVLGSSSVETSLSRGECESRPGWVEVHPQNYFCDGGPPHRWLEAVCEELPVSFHSVGLSLGSADGLAEDELRALAKLCQRYQPASVSDHLSWSGTANNRYPDLLPLPYTQECLTHFTAQVGRVQDALGRAILIENPSRYLAFTDEEMGEAEFLQALCNQSGCGLLLDINNIEVSANNLGIDPFAMLDSFDPAPVGEVHLAGHAVEDHADGPLFIDDHGSPVSDVTWRLFERFMENAGPKPVLIEWDTDVPEYEVLIGEADKATAIMHSVGVSHAA